jgi:hypothetical protein
MIEDVVVGLRRSDSFRKMSSEPRPFVSSGTWRRADERGAASFDPITRCCEVPTQSSPQPDASVAVALDSGDEGSQESRHRKITCQHGVDDPSSKVGGAEHGH